MEGTVKAPTEEGIHVIDLKKGETLRDPASTKRLIYGPQRVVWEVHPSGITATVERVG